MYTDTHTHIHTHVFTHMHRYTYTHIYTTCAYTHHTYTYIYTWTHTFIFVCMQTHTHTYKHTLTHSHSLIYFKISHGFIITLNQIYYRHILLYLKFLRLQIKEYDLGIIFFIISKDLFSIHQLIDDTFRYGQH